MVEGARFKARKQVRGGVFPGAETATAQTRWSEEVSVLVIREVMRLKGKQEARQAAAVFLNCAS